MSKKVHYINKDAVRGILNGLQGRVCTVSAVKKDGTVTKHNGKLQDSPPSHKNHKQLFTIKRMSDGGFRSFNDEQVTRIAGDGQVYEIRSNLAEII